ncbi:hypothetical protein PEB0122_017730 [Bartonella apis]|nr:hypothetical protein PEB0122_017730 [Bartonella apis]
MVQDPLTAFRLESRQTVKRDVPVLCGAHAEAGSSWLLIVCDTSMFHGIISLMME